MFPRFQGVSNVSRTIPRCLSFFVRRLHGPSLAYAATTFAAILIDSLFKFYYVKIFLIRYKITDSWFNMAQVVFMIWNAVNDPLFGYLQDNSSPSSIFRVRRKSILYGAPLFALSFVTFWFPWDTGGSWLVGLHLMTSLCFYDALYTFVLLAQCALFAEMSTAHEDRLRLVLYSQVASLLGSWSVMASDLISSGLANFSAFQLSTVVIAFISWGGFTVTGLNAKTEVAQISDAVCIMKGSPPPKEPSEFFSKESTVPRVEPPSSSIYKQTLEILRQPNFLSFVFMNFLQISHVTFHSNFASIFLDILLPSDVISARTRSIFSGSLFICPQILVLCLSCLLRSHGSYWVVRYSFCFKIVLSGCLGFLSLSSWLLAFRSETRALLLLLFIVCDSAAGTATFSTFNLLVSDVIDDDMKVNKRASPLSSTIFGTNALITKPAMSLAPMLVIYLLNPFGFEAFKMESKTIMQDVDTFNELKYATLHLIWAWPLIIGCLQYLVFLPYNLRSSHHNVVAKHVES